MRTLTRPIFVAAIAATITSLAARADDTYIGLNTTWSTPAAWSNNTPPTSTDNVLISPTVPDNTTNTLTLNTSTTIQSLTLGANTGGTTNLLLTNFPSLTTTSLSILPTGLLSGNGTLYTPTSVNNLGTIRANVAGTQFTLTPFNPNVPASFTNAGTLEATNGATLSINNTSYSSSPTSTMLNTGTISATGTNSRVILFGDITGGTISSDAASAIIIQGSLSNLTLSGNISITAPSFPSTFNFSNVTLNGNLTDKNATSISTDITNNANWSQSAFLFVSNSPTIAGNGTLTLRSSIVGTNTSSLTIGPNQTIQGFGRLAASLTSITNNGRILANDQIFLVSAPLTNNGHLDVAPNCTMTVGPLTSTSGQIHVDGTLSLANNTTAAAITGNGTLSVNYGTAATPGLISDAIQLNALNISNGSVQIRPNPTTPSTSTLTTLSLSSANNTFNSSLDLTTNPLILAISDSSTLPTTLSQLTAGALFTSTPNLALALIDNSSLTTPYTTFAGQQVSPNSLLITPALPGDTNLDNKVDLTDLSTLLNNFGTQTPNWTSGNFDHTPIIDLTDLSAVLNNFGTTNPNPSGLQITDYRLPAPAPEPISLALLLTPLVWRSAFRRRTSTCSKAS